MKTLVEAPDHELVVLENIYSQADHVRQRDLARVVGLSLGMTNAIVKRLVQKGWLTIRKVNNRNIRYAVSSEGLEQITKRSYRYLRRTIKNIVSYREAIEAFVKRVAEDGYSKISLVGFSDLDFIVEHACSRFHVELIRNESSIGQEPGPGACVLYAENFRPLPKKGEYPHVSYLQEIVNSQELEIAGHADGV
jgi:DNA-binding MarR family transcriptional regulator